MLKVAAQQCGLGHYARFRRDLEACFGDAADASFDGTRSSRSYNECLLFHVNRRPASLHRNPNRFVLRGCCYPSGLKEARFWWVMEKDGTFPNGRRSRRTDRSFAHVIGIGQSRACELWAALESFDLIWKVPQPRLLRTRRCRAGCFEMPMLAAILVIPRAVQSLRGSRCDRPSVDPRARPCAVRRTGSSTRCRPRS
jgi:hypothetical protein